MRQALRAHEFWLRNGFEADLVVLNEYPGGYIQPVQDELEKIVGASHAHQMLNRPGGVYVKRGDIMPEADRILLNSIARVVLVGSRGSLDVQLDREVPEPTLPPLLLRPNSSLGRRRHEHAACADIHLARCACYLDASIPVLRQMDVST